MRACQSMRMITFTFDPPGNRDQALVQAPVRSMRHRGSCHRRSSHAAIASPVVPA
ncbi:MAG: hypothetical protein U0P45_16125 [Acidimicrobiales bacterium]